jgi:DNA-binding CsgD family transcriptional regulator
MSELGDRAVELHLQGVRSIDIAHRLNVAQSTVHYHLRRLTDPPAVIAPARPQRYRKPQGARSTVRTSERVAALLALGRSRAEIARRLGIAKSTVSYHARQLGASIDERFRRRYEWASVQAFYDEGNSVRDCAREFGFSTASWQDAVKRGVITPRPAFRPVEEIFAANTRRNRGHLKTRLLRLGLKDRRCERCGISDWHGQPLAVALHHINGDRLDNRLENLELLCPNCHSQTDTFSGRNGRRTAPMA